MQEDICFAKLDLQGAEYQALQGMQRHMQNKLDMMWIEYLFHPRYESYKIIDYLQSDYELFDTEYLFYGKPTILAHHHFNINKTKILSNDRLVYSGFKKIQWSNYKDETLFLLRN